MAANLTSLRENSLTKISNHYISGIRLKSSCPNDIQLNERTLSLVELLLTESSYPGLSPSGSK